LAATFHSDNQYLSPVLNMDQLGLVCSQYTVTASAAQILAGNPNGQSYITYSVSGLNYENMTIALYANTPTNTEIRVFVSVDDGYTWTELSIATSSLVDSFWTENTYTNVWGGEQSQFRVRIDLVSST